MWERAGFWVYDGTFTETEISKREVDLGQRRNTEFGFERGQFSVSVRNSSGHDQHAVVYLHGI